MGKQEQRNDIKITVRRGVHRGFVGVVKHEDRRRALIPLYLAVTLFLLRHFCYLIVVRIW